MTEAETKACARCKTEKPRSAFCKDMSQRDMINHTCRECKKGDFAAYLTANRERQSQRAAQYREANLEEMRAKDRSRYAADPGKSAKKCLGWRKRNPQRVNELAAKWKANNKAKVLANVKARKAGQVQACPKWVTREQRSEMRAIYIRSAAISAETGIKHHVDHIVPLRGKTVCGLHVPWNLQVIPAKENMAKHNFLLAEAA